ncbi:MAG: MFS transporter [Nanoarchaeota archaeon]|nr:MFS transporter [Nanoarchaeota archaeon]
MLNIFHRHRKHITKIENLGLVGLVLTIGVASVDSVWAIYLFSFLQSEAKVGFLAGIFTAVSFFISLALVPFIERMDESRMYKWIIFINGFLYLAFAINRSFIIMIILAITNVIIITTRITTFGIITRNESRIKDISKDEGMIYTLLNIGWLIGPLIGGFAADKFSINFVFLLAFIFMMMSFLMSLRIRLKRSRIAEKNHKHLLRNFIQYFKKWNRISAYIFACGVAFWWGFIFIFMPLEIIKSGLSLSYVGIFLFFITFPVIFLEYHAGKIADKQGCKKFFVRGFLLLSLISGCLFFVNNIFIIAVSLIFASFVLAYIEPLQESYFFKCIKKKDEERYYPIFITNKAIAQTVSRILIASVLLVFSFNYIFITVSLVMLAMFFAALHIKDPIAKHIGMKVK